MTNNFVECFDMLRYRLNKGIKRPFFDSIPRIFSEILPIYKKRKDSVESYPKISKCLEKGEIVPSTLVTFRCKLSRIFFLALIFHNLLDFRRNYLNILILSHSDIILENL